MARKPLPTAEEVRKAANETFKTLSPKAKEVMQILFLYGPVKSAGLQSVGATGLGDLITARQAFAVNGWASLTPAGVTTAARADVKRRKDPSWFNKQTAPA